MERDREDVQPAAVDVCWATHDRPTSVCLKSVFFRLVGQLAYRHSEKMDWNIAIMVLAR